MFINFYNDYLEISSDAGLSLSFRHCIVSNTILANSCQWHSINQLTVFNWEEGLGRNQEIFPRKVKMSNVTVKKLCYLFQIIIHPCLICRADVQNHNKMKSTTSTKQQPREGLLLSTTRFNKTCIPDITKSKCLTPLMNSSMLISD